MVIFSGLIHRNIYIKNSLMTKVKKRYYHNQKSLGEAEAYLTVLKIK